MRISRSVRSGWDAILRGHEVQGLRNEEGTLLWVPEEYGSVGVLHKAAEVVKAPLASEVAKVRPELPEMVVGGYASPQVVDKEKHLITKEAMIADLPRFLAHPHYRNVMVVHCAVAGTRVRVGPGHEQYKAIEDVRPGERVYTHKARLRTVTATTRHEGPAMLVRVELANGEVLKLTANHRLLTTGGWVRAEHLTTDHVLNHLAKRGHRSQWLAERMDKNTLRKGLSDGTKGKRKATVTGRQPWMTGATDRKGKTYTEIYGEGQGALVVERIGDALRGERSHFWKGGVSRRPYGAGFSEELKEAVRERDGRTCVLCVRTEAEELESYGRRLSVDHISWDKQDHRKENLRSLCVACHGARNGEARVKVANGVGIRSVLFVPNSEPVYNLEVEEDSSYAGFGCIHHNTNIQVGEVLPEWTHPETGEVYKTKVDDIGLFAVVKIRTDPFRPAIVDQVIKDIESGELAAFSISGDAPYESRQYQCADGTCFWVINEIEHYEITLCQKGVNQDAKYAILSKAAFCQDGVCPVRIPTERVTLRTIRSAVAKAAADGEDAQHEGEEGDIEEKAISAPVPPKPPSISGKPSGAGESSGAGDWRTGEMSGGNPAADVQERAGAPKRASMTSTDELFTAEGSWHGEDEHRRAVRFLEEHGRAYVAGQHPTRRAALELGDGDLTVRLSDGRAVSTGRYSADQVNEATQRALKFVQTGGREHGPMELHDTPDSPHKEHMGGREQQEGGQRRTGRGPEAEAELERRRRVRVISRKRPVEGTVVWTGKIRGELYARVAVDRERGSHVYRLDQLEAEGDAEGKIEEQSPMSAPGVASTHRQDIGAQGSPGPKTRSRSGVVSDPRFDELGAAEEKATDMLPGIVSSPHSRNPGTLTQEELTGGIPAATGSDRRRTGGASESSTCRHGCYATVEDLEKSDRPYMPVGDEKEIPPEVMRATLPGGGEHAHSMEDEEYYLNKAVDLETVVLCVALNPDGHPVAGIRQDRKHGEAYEFPGGHAQAGESLGRTAERELQEETGVRAQAIRKLGEKRSPSDGAPVVFVQLEITGGEPADSSELTDVSYCNPDEVDWAFGDSREAVNVALGGALEKGPQTFGRDVPYGRDEESGEFEEKALTLDPEPQVHTEDVNVQKHFTAKPHPHGQGQHTSFEQPREGEKEVSPEEARRQRSLTPPRKREALPALYGPGGRRRHSGLTREEEQKHTTDTPHPHGRQFGSKRRGASGTMEDPLGEGKFPWQRKVGKNCALCETETVLEQALDVREWRSTASADLRLMSRFGLNSLRKGRGLTYVEGRWFALARDEDGIMRKGLAVELNSLVSMVGEHALNIGVTDLWGAAFNARSRIDKGGPIRRQDAYQQLENILSRMFGLRDTISNNVVHSLLVLMTDYQVQEQEGLHKGYGFGWYANAQRTLARAAGTLRQQVDGAPDHMKTAFTAILDDIDQLEGQLGVTREMEKGLLHEAATRSDLDIVREVAKTTETDVEEADAKLEAVGARKPEPSMSGEPASALNDPAQQTGPENVNVQAGTPQYVTKTVED